ncbi:hypothetical protein DPMN_156265 [Dreissena polymorpha]|uniref:Uncharacterized protein n=2 Tax=Dreissena polymorpha TaxID=45954 RepID=A0A9D4FQE6_DREPO|nr:hypothetical protein DPMN_156265 [Dreissena polymorpha]
MLTILKNICMSGDLTVVENKSPWLPITDGERKNMEYIERFLHSPSFDNGPGYMADVMLPSNETAGIFGGSDPEAIFDFITIRSMHERYGNIETPRGKIGRHDRTTYENEAIYQNEAEFETFVQQFPIDDSIAECFATTDGDADKLDNKYVSGGKRPQISTKYSKMKKRFGKKSADDISLMSEEDPRSRDLKRSKKYGGVFSKRHKWRGFVSSTNKNTSSISKQAPHHTRHTEDFSKADMQVRSSSSTINAEVHHIDSSASDSQITSFSETLAHAHSLSSGTNTNELEAESTTSGSVFEDEFDALLHGNTTDMISRIEDLPPDQVLKLRDQRGNTLLHRSMLVGNPDLVKYVLEKFPEMTSDINAENETAVEMAAKHGQFDCLKVMLERSHRRHALGPAMLNRLLNVCAQHGQAECLYLLLNSVTREPHSACALPGDVRGNTAAHLAAKHGHVQCLHTLVACGYDVTSENLLQQRPLHVAHQSRSHVCFEYLLLLNMCARMWALLHAQTRLNASLLEQNASCRASIDNVTKCLRKYEHFCKDTEQSLSDTKQDVLHTLRGLHERLTSLSDVTTLGAGEQLRGQLAELTSEIELIEDTFDFSPLADLHATLRKLDASLVEALSSVTERTSNDRTYPPTTDEVATQTLCGLLKDIHREYILENWNTEHLYEKYLSNTGLGVPGFFDVGATSNFTSSNVKSFNVTSSKDASNTFENPAEACSTKSGQAEEQSVKAAKKNTDLSKSLEKCDSARKKQTANTDSGTFENSASAVHSTKRDAPEDCVRRTHTKDQNSYKQFKNDTKEDIDHEEVDINKLDKSDDKNQNGEGYATDLLNDPTERPFTKLLSLDERIDLLIAGERRKEREIDGSIHTSSGSLQSSHSMDPPSTFTSVTSHTSGASDWYNKLALTSLETAANDYVTNNEVSRDATSDTTSYWWDVEERGYANEDGMLSAMYADNIRRRVHVHCDNASSSYDDLRRQRIASHLKAVQQTRFTSDNYRERITTSSGEVMGGFDTPPEVGPQRRVHVDVTGALRNRDQSKQARGNRKPGKPRLFTLEDAIDATSESEADFRYRYKRPRDQVLSVRWEDMSMTDDDDRGPLSWLERELGGMGSRSSGSDTISVEYAAQSFV